MKKILFSLAFIASLSAFADVKWQETVYDFGAFSEEMGAVSCDFVFVNNGPDAVAVTAARASCGCTTPKYTRDVVAPGDTGHITVTYDPAGRPGRFEKSVAVDFSDKSRTKLRVKGTVVGSSESVSQRFPVECSSGLRLAKPVVMLGDVPKGKLRSVFLQGYNRSTEPMSPGVTGLPPYLEVTVSPEVVPPGEQFSFVFYMRSDKCPLYGFVADTVNVQTAAGLGCELTVTAIIKEDFSKLSEKDIKKSPIAHLAAETIDFGTLQSDSETRTATVKNLGKSTLEIRRVYSADPGVSVEVDRTSIKPGKEATLTVKVNRAQLRGSLLNARIQLITNDPMAPVQNLRASGLIGE